MYKAQFYEVDINIFVFRTHVLNVSADISKTQYV